MKVFLSSIAFLLSVVCSAQFVLEPRGFNTVVLERPNLSDDALIEAVRSWIANEYQHNDAGYDIFGEKQDRLRWSSEMHNAFYYVNRGETQYHRIKYECAFRFDAERMFLDFRVIEIYTGRQPTQLTPGSFFDDQGVLKDDYLDAKPSLEASVNRLLRSFSGFMARYK